MAFTEKRFKNETEARKHLESVRWPDGPICPHCGVVNHSHQITGKSARPGLWFCADCRKQFTVTVGTLFEDSKVPLHKWLLAVHLMAASKKGISSHQLHRMLGVTYKTAWFMAHRIRESMADVPTGPLGGEGKTIEADETYFGNKPGMQRRNMGSKHKYAIVGLVERGGAVRTFHVEKANAKTVWEVISRNADRASALHTDESHIYSTLGHEFSSHETVNHAIKEYARGPVTTNSIEGYFSIFKRGMRGVYQHCSEKHLTRYLSEFDFRYNNRVALGVNDDQRAQKALKGIGGKRLTYRRTNEAANA